MNTLYRKSSDIGGFISSVYFVEENPDEEEKKKEIECWRRVGLINQPGDRRRRLRRRRVPSRNYAKRTRASIADITESSRCNAPAKLSRRNKETLICAPRAI